MRISNNRLLMRADDGVEKFTFIAFTRHIAAFLYYIYIVSMTKSANTHSASHVFVLECLYMYGNNIGKLYVESLKTSESIDS